ncbi:MAG: type II toxin-antitoxin system RelE/ParE family toxin [Gluconacetobacter sp.]
MASYRTTNLADDDIVAAYVQGVRDFGVEHAERYHARLAATFDLIARHPEMAPERTAFEPPVRIHRHQAHHIIYLIDDEGVLIVRLLPRYRDWEALVFQ